MNKQTIFVGAALALSVVFGRSAPALGFEIRGQRIVVPGPLQANQEVPLDLSKYWRSNLKLDSGRLVGNKHDFPHVPNLIEYRIELPVGGHFDLEARYALAQPAPANLTCDGLPIASVFDQASTDAPAWRKLGEIVVTPGEHRLRFTSRSVDAEFAAISAMRLVFRGGTVPAAESLPPIVGERPQLSADWSHTISRKIHSDFHTAGFIDGIGKYFDKAQFADGLADAGVNSICVFAKGHHGYAYYNTRIGTRHPGLDFDLMGAQIEACHKRGIAVWVYFSVGYDELYTSTQEQKVERADDRNTKIVASPQSVYVRENMWPMIDECVRNYDLDGVFFDFPGDETFVDLTVERIKKIKPGVVVAYNHQWNRSRAELGTLDVLEIESWRHKQPLYHWQYFARYARGAVPVTAMTIRFWKSWGDFGGMTDEPMLRYQIATALANGCLVTVGDHLHPYGRLDPAVYDRVGRVLGECKALEPYVLKSESVPYVALWRPERVGLIGADGPCHALVDAGVHFTVIDSTQDVTPFAAVVLPENAAVSAAYVERLDTYVRDGGCLIACGKITPELAKIFGVQQAPQTQPAYVHVDAKALPSPPPTDLFTYFDVFPITTSEGARVLAPFVWPIGHGTSHGSRRQSPPSDKPSEYAAITSRSYGKGHALYSGAPLLDCYARMGYTPMRQMLSDLLRIGIAPERRIAEVESAAPLEVSVNRQGKRIIVHLVHCPQSRHSVGSMNEKEEINQNPIIDGAPMITGARLIVPASLVGDRHVRLLRPVDASVETRTEDGRVVLSLPPFAFHAIVVFE